MIGTGKKMQEAKIFLWHFLCETLCPLWFKLLLLWRGDQKLEPQRTQGFTEERTQR
jgi:hypothetical protein